MRALNGIWVTWKFGGKDGLRYCVIKDAYGLKEVQEKKKKPSGNSMFLRSQLLRKERPLCHGGLGP